MMLPVINITVIVNSYPASQGKSLSVHVEDFK